MLQTPEEIVIDTEKAEGDEDTISVIRSVCFKVKSLVSEDKLRDCAERVYSGGIVLKTVEQFRKVFAAFGIIVEVYSHSTKPTLASDIPGLKVNVLVRTEGYELQQTLESSSSGGTNQELNGRHVSIDFK